MGLVATETSERLLCGGYATLVWLATDVGIPWRKVLPPFQRFEPLIYGWLNRQKKP